MRPKQIGVGSGNNQGFGPAHHTYKSGIGAFWRLRKEACENCGSTRFLCVHHKDEDRTNNVEGNLETLCKRCHQVHHGCVDNLPQTMSDERRKWQSEHMKHLNATAKRGADGRILKQSKECE